MSEMDSLSCLLMAERLNLTEAQTLLEKADHLRPDNELVKDACQVMARFIQNLKTATGLDKQEGRQAMEPGSRTYAYLMEEVLEGVDLLNDALNRETEEVLHAFVNTE